MKVFIGCSSSDELDKIYYEEYENLENYRRISKTDYSEKDMTIEEYKAFIKEQKRQNNR